MKSIVTKSTLTIIATAAFFAIGVKSNAQSFRVKVSSGLNGFYDETMVHFGIGVPTVDPSDIPKIGMGGGAAPGIASVSADGADLMFNAHGPISGDISVPIKVSCGVNGVYTLTIYDVQGLFGVSCITLEDQLLQTSIPVAQGMTYNYFMNTATPIDPARFLLHMNAPLQAATTNSSCASAIDGIVSIPVSGMGPWSVMWPDAQTGQVALETFTTSPIELFGGVGNYSATLSHADGCTQGFLATIASDPGPIAAFSPSTALAMVGEVVTFSNNSTAGTDANWSFGDGASSTDEQPTHAFTLPGIYTVSLTASLNGCDAMATTLIEVEDANGIEEVSVIDVAVFVQADRIMVTWAETDQVLNAELFSATGRSVSPAQRSLNSNSPMYVTTSGLPAGGYILRVWNSTALRSYLVPLAH